MSLALVVVLLVSLLNILGHKFFHFPKEQQFHLHKCIQDDKEMHHRSDHPHHNVFDNELYMLKISFLIRTPKKLENPYFLFDYIDVGDKWMLMNLSW